MADLQEFWDQLNRGPAVLFLGQDYLRLENGVDPLLNEIQSKFGISVDKPNYNLLVESNASESGDSALTWMSERCRRLSAPDWLQSIAEFHWNSVFSSAIDPIWLQTFRNEWREVAPIYDDDYFPRDPRNRRVLHCTFLFGSLNQIEPKQRPPLSRPEFLTRKQTAISLARRLLDTLTPMGILAIEAYKGDEDWFSLDDFYPVLNAMGSAQVHLFSVTKDLENHPLVCDLVKSHRLVIHPEGLSWAINRGLSQGFIQRKELLEWDSTNRRVTLRRVSIPIPRHLWNRISNSATLMDDSLLVQPPPISPDAVSWEFRRFLFECGARPLWSGFARGFAFPRAFEEYLEEKTTKQLDREASTDQPIVVHGQTGTGKTVALGALAFKLAKSGKYPVIFIERKTQRPIDSDLDECCRWLEEHGANATLIVWDGMVQQSDYHELQGYLASRGRKAVVVGSCYRLNISDDHLIEVPEQLTAHEAKLFADFLRGLGISLDERHREALEKRDSSYLVALYRHLSPTRPQITTGVVQELEQLERELVNAVNRSIADESPIGSLAAAFLSAGLINESFLEETRHRPEVQISVSTVAELIDLVTVPGRFGLNVPIELLARAWGASNFVDVAQILRGLDLIHAFEDSSGRVVVGPRHPLEAQLIVRARVGTVQDESAIISKIVKAIRPSIWGADESDEISFVIELLRSVGPQGNERDHFAPYFRELAEAIAELRESRNIRVPRLMLQEANLLREWVTAASQRGNHPEESTELLGKVQATLQEAFEMSKNTRQWRLRTFIATELAATFGSATMDFIIAGASNNDVRQSLRRVREAVQTARSEDFSTYNPVDVLVWSTTAFAQYEDVDQPTRVDALVDALDALETVDPDLLDSGNLERLHRRRYELGKLLNDEVISESAFQSLLTIGSAAGFYLRAWEIGGPVGQSEDPLRVSKYAHMDAWSYLEKHRNQISQDPRCLNLLFDYWWLSTTGHRLFDGERVVLPFQQQDWEYALQLIRDLKEFPGSKRGLTLSFLEALALFHLGQIRGSLQLFREIENESYMVPRRRRILRSFLAGDSGTSPRKFHGTVRRVEQGGHRAQVFVEELRQSITFIPTDFGLPEIRTGDSLGEFHIAFNFIGVIADPVTRSRP